MTLFWSLKLVFLLHSLKFTQREKKRKERGDDTVAISFQISPSDLAESRSQVRSISLFLLLLLLLLLFFIHASKFIRIFMFTFFWFDCAVLIKQWNWITTGSSLTMFVSTFRSFSPSSFFFLLYWFSLFNEVVSWIDLFYKFS